MPITNQTGKQVSWIPQILRTTWNTAISAHRSGSNATSPGTVVWLTGRPATGKTTLAGVIADVLRLRGDDVVAFDDDDLRQLAAERSVLDAQGLYMALLHEVNAAVEAGATVVISTTTSERAYREAMREAVPYFVEVWLVCTEVELWRRELARAPRFDQATIPVGFPYQPPEKVDLLLDSTTRTPADLSVAVVAYLDTMKAHQRSVAA